MYRANGPAVAALGSLTFIVPAGNLAAGVYTGYGITCLGDPSELAGERLLRCAVAALGGLLVMAASLGLERACRVPSDPPGP